MRSMFLACIIIAVLAIENVNLQYNQPRYRHRVYVLTPSGPVYVNPYERKNPIELITAQSDRDITVTTEHVVRNDAKKVRLDVYYETDCPDSMRFITRQLYPLYQEMEDVLDIHLVPYGKAHETYNDESQKYEHWCQHGPSECYGNTVQSCVISLYPKTKDYLDFIYCMEAYPRPSHSARKCARRLSLDWDKIEKCAKGEEGNRLLHENAQLTENLNPRLYFVPWIVVDKAFTESNQRLALRSLSNVVCNSYKGNHPKCNR